MNSNLTSAPDTSYVTPWTLRAYDSLPGSPIWIGIGFTAGLFLVFFVGRALLDGAANSSTNDYRVAIIHILQTGYTASAYAYLLITARKTTNDLAPFAAQSVPIANRVSKHPWWALLLAGAAYCLVFGIATTNATTPDSVNPWHWESWNYDIFWHRVTSVLFNWWSGCFFYVVVVESARLSNLSGAIKSLDLLELVPYHPLIRQGLTNALLVIGMVSVASLLLVESRYGPMLVGAWIVGVMFAWIVLMLPLRGIRKKIKIAKHEELDWCRRALKTARDELKAGALEQQSVAEVIAYKTMIDNIRNWPFDNPTLVRFALYLLIPLGSWLGGAFVERGLDLFLS